MVIYILNTHCCSWLPVFPDADQKIGVMSISFLLDNKDDAVIWRGPKKNCTFIFVCITYFNIVL